MPINMQELVDQIKSDNTVLILGAGASIPSGAPSVSDLIDAISKAFRIEIDGLSLSEIAGLAEHKRNRSELIKLIREKFKDLRPKGALLNVPNHTWKSIYTTNYDELIEDAYQRANKHLTVFSSNFDFQAQSNPIAMKLLKLHGTIAQDSVDGYVHNMILTQADYDASSEFRETLYTRLKDDLNPGSNVIVIGQSLTDPHLQDLIAEVIKINKRVSSGGRIFLLLYEQNETRAAVYELRGLRVVFGSLDSFIAAMDKKAPDVSTIFRDTGNLLDTFNALRPFTTDVEAELSTVLADPSSIFNGWPATYSDISSGLTFDRTCVGKLTKLIDQDDKQFVALLGASGVGKTTAARQAILKLKGKGYQVWEHKVDLPLQKSQWVSVATRLSQTQQKGVLFIDEAHNHLYELNQLVDELAASELAALKFICVAAKNHWAPRVKSQLFYKYGKEVTLSKLDSGEVEELLVLVERNSALNRLVESGFNGFSRIERRRRLIERCDTDMFVCLKNIFASEKFDDIILREFASLNDVCADIYRYVAVMSHAGIHVHRQLIVRILGISSDSIRSVLSGLVGIVTEHDVNVREGIYGWKVRHSVIAAIIAKYKFREIDAQIELFARVIANISPTYDIEMRTVRSLCSAEAGLRCIPDKEIQNKLLRQLISIAPGERVPRHCLIRNLISIGEFEKADTEIRIYEKDLKREPPIERYKIMLLIARATETEGLLKEDRLAILSEARGRAAAATERYRDNKYVLSAYCELGVRFFMLSGSHTVYDEAMKVLRSAESGLGDPDITKMVIRYERRLSGNEAVPEETDPNEPVTE